MMMNIQCLKNILLLRRRLHSVTSSHYCPTHTGTVGSADAAFTARVDQRRVSQRSQPQHYQHAAAATETSAALLQRHDHEHDASLSLLQHMKQILVHNGRQSVVCITGAGISTDSNIPDYRSPGRPPHQPMSHQTFISSHEARQRYWARSMVGYHRMKTAQPNTGHRMLAYAQQHSYLRHIITQNVDDLHEAAGATDVLHLHGDIHRVRCLSCQHVQSRAAVQQQLERDNAEFAQHIDELLQQSSRIHASRQQQHHHHDYHPQQRSLSDEQSSRELFQAHVLVDPSTASDKPLHTAIQLRPDGDVELNDHPIYNEMIIPQCHQCGGVLKPDVVFFGANVPKPVSAAADEMIAAADAVMVVGTTLTTWSAFRLVRAALLKAGKKVDEKGAITASSLSFSDAAAAALHSTCPVIMINDGVTRADAIVDMKYSGRAASALQFIYADSHT